MDSEQNEIINCPHCGAENPAEAASCSRCSKQPVLYIGPTRAFPRRFGLGRVMFFIALLALGFSLIRDAPGLAVLVLLFLIPAFVRMTAAASQRAEDQRAMPLDAQFEVFMTSLMIIGLTIFVSCFTFFCVCSGVGLVTRGWPGLGLGDLALYYVVIGLSSAAAVGVGILLLRKLWPFRD